MENEVEHDPEDLVFGLRDLVWEYAGIVRIEDDIREDLEKVEDLEERAQNLSVAGGRRDSRRTWKSVYFVRRAQAALDGALDPAVVQRGVLAGEVDAPLRGDYVLVQEGFLAR